MLKHNIWAAFGPFLFSEMFLFAGFGHGGCPGVGLPLVAPPAVRKTWVCSLGWEDPLEEDMTTHSSILAWRIPMDRGAWWATVHGGRKESDTSE